MTRSAAGKGRRCKAGLNRSLAAVGLSENQQILVNQCLKRGIHVIPVSATGTSQTCPRCGHRHRENRETQASFRCRHCGWAGHADHSAAQVIRNRGFVRIAEFIHGFTPCVQDAPTGWQEQPSRYGGSHCCPWLKTRSSQRAARRSRAGPVGNRQGPRLQAGHPRSSVLPSRQLGQCAHRTAATNPWKPGLPKVYKHACHEYSSTLFNIVE